MTALRFTGSVDALRPGDRNALLARSAANDSTIAERTGRIIADVRARGDEALRALAEELDGVALDSLEVPSSVLRRALDETPAALRRAMERTARNVATVHGAFMPAAIEVEPEPGIVVGRRPDPLDRVGIYAPGGRAAYPSSVLMGAIPARVAGVREMIVCSPPGQDGLPSQPVLAAAALAGVDRVFAVGGAGAIAAMAFGTTSVPRVNRIVGPGNAYVATAKLQVVGDVAIDSPAGPSELVVIADDSADPEAVALEMVAQAEHDPLACVVAIVVGDHMTACITRAVDAAAAAADRRDIVSAALAGQGGILTARTFDDAVALANDYAPEHLLLCVRDLDRALAMVRNAGTVFVGTTASVAFGDYMTGANHVLPTGGLARSYSGLSTLDFVRWTTYQRVTRGAAAELANDVGCFADAEALPAHAATARQWSTR
jgi:histidinol dehydrogenase